MITTSLSPVAWKVLPSIVTVAPAITVNTEPFSAPVTLRLPPSLTLTMLSPSDVSVTSPSPSNVIFAQAISASVGLNLTLTSVRAVTTAPFSLVKLSIALIVTVAPEAIVNSLSALASPVTSAPSLSVIVLSAVEILIVP